MPKMFPEDLPGPARAFLGGREVSSMPIDVQRDLSLALCGGYPDAASIPTKTRELLEQADLLDQAVHASETVEFVIPLGNGEE